MLTRGCGRLLFAHTLEPVKPDTANLNRTPEHPAMLVCAGRLLYVAIKRDHGGGRSKP